MYQLYAREWQLFKDNYFRGFLVISVISLLSALGLYGFLVSKPEVIRMVMERLVSMFEEIGITPEMDHWQLFLVILKNNLRAALVTMALGIVPIIILPFLSPVLTTMTVAIAMAFVQLEGGEPLILLLAGILPHGIIELPAIYLSGSIGFFISINLARKIFLGHNGLSFKEIIWQAGRSYLLVVVPLIFLAAVLESTITPFLLGRYF